MTESGLFGCAGLLPAQLVELDRHPGHVQDDAVGKGDDLRLAACGSTLPDLSQVGDGLVGGCLGHRSAIIPEKSHGNQSGVKERGIWYLASPYSSPDPEIVRWRYEAAVAATAFLIRQGRIIFSPICHSHCLAEHGMPGDWSFWERIDRAFIERCDRLVVLKLDGWHESRGVMAEIRIASDLGLPVEFIDPQSLGISNEQTTPIRAVVAGEAI